MSEISHALVDPAPTSRGLPPRAARWLRKHAGILAVMVFAACFLSPLLESGFYHDDTLSSCTAGLIQLEDSPLSTWVGNHILQQKADGQLYPVATAITDTLHNYFPTAFPHKVLALVLLLTNLLEFYWLLRCWKVPPAMAQLGTLSLVLMLQMRLVPDPLLSFTGIMPLVAAQLMLSIICLQKHLDSGRLGWLAASSVIYLSSLLTSGVSYCFLPIYMAMAYARFGRWRPVVATTRPHFVGVVFLGAYVLGLGVHNATAGQQPYGINLAPNLMTDAFYRQNTAALPLSYSLMNMYRKHDLEPWHLVARWDNWAIVLAAVVLTVGLLRTLRRSAPEEQRPRLRFLWAMGGLVWILPCVPIVLFGKYQLLVRQPGTGYLPIYLQYLGVALLCVATFLWFITSYPLHRRMGAVGLIAMNACVALITFDTNRTVVEISEAAPAHNNRRNMEMALTAGVADLVPAGATILSATWNPWPTGGLPYGSAFFTQSLNRKIHFVTCPAEPSQFQQRAALNDPAFVLVARRLDDRTSYVILGSLESVAGSCQELSYGMLRFRVFVRDELGSAGFLATGCIAGGSLDSPAQSDDRFREQIRFADLTRVGSGQGWAVYEGSFQHITDIATIELRRATTVASQSRQTRSIVARSVFGPDGIGILNMAGR